MAADSSSVSSPDPLDLALEDAVAVVVDASLAVDAVLGEAGRKARALRFLRVCQARRIALIVPSTFFSETDTAVRKIGKCDQLSLEVMSAIFDAFDTLPLDMSLRIAEIEAVRRRARQIADELGLVRVYDATYAALAEVRDCNFWTADEKFAGAARQLRRMSDGTMAPTLANVRWIGDF